MTIRRRQVFGLMCLLAVVAAGVVSWASRPGVASMPRRIADYHPATSGHSPHHLAIGVEVALLVAALLSLWIWVRPEARRPDLRSDWPALAAVGVAVVGGVIGSLGHRRDVSGVLSAGIGKIEAEHVTSSLTLYPTAPWALLGVTGVLALVAAVVERGRRAVLVLGLVVAVVGAIAELHHSAARPVSFGFLVHGDLGQRTDLGSATSPVWSHEALACVLLVQAALLGLCFRVRRVS